MSILEDLPQISINVEANGIIISAPIVANSVPTQRWLAPDLLAV